MNTRSINPGSSYFGLLKRAFFVCSIAGTRGFAQDAKVVEIGARYLASDVARITVRLPVVDTISKLLRIHAVDTFGVVLDKIFLASRQLPQSYFGPAETTYERSKQ